jgi:surfeit locus 1 family protein
MSPRARSLLFFAASLAVALVCLRLGVWQLGRLRERRAANRVAQAARALPPIALDDRGQTAGLAPTGFNNRRVRVTGQYDHAADIVIRGQTEGGVPGVRIVTPLRPLGSDSAILVQRGYVTSADARRVQLTPLNEPGVKTVTGLAFALSDSGVAGEPLEQDGQLTWRRIDLAALRSRLPYPLRTYFILQTPDSALPALPRRDDPPVLDDGPHLSYAIQWLGFAITAIVVGGIVAFRGTGYRVPGTGYE